MTNHFGMQPEIPKSIYVITCIQLTTNVGECKMTEKLHDSTSTNYIEKDLNTLFSP